MTTTKSKPVERICSVCRTKKNVADLIRVARIDGKFFLDSDGNANGRGCRVCPECVEKCVKTRALNRSFKTAVPQSVYDELVAETKKLSK